MPAPSPRAKPSQDGRAALQAPARPIARLAAGVVTGVGFLGAGVIMRDHGQVTGLTTAATIWISAALGMGLGFGAYQLVGVATVAVLFVLWFVPHLDITQRANDTRSFEAVAPYAEDRLSLIHISAPTRPY